MLALAAAGALSAWGGLGCGGAGGAGVASGPGAAAPRAAAKVRIALLAPAWATEPPGPPVDVAPLIRGLESSGGVTVTSLPAAASCEPEPACLEGALGDNPAEEVLSVRLAALGDTVLVRASLVDRKRGTQDAARQEVVQGLTPQVLSAALERLGIALGAPFAPAPPPPAPIVKTAWFWGVVAGAVALTAAIAGGAVYAAERRPDVVIVPP